MNPRKKESKKWSSLPKELIEQIRAVFSENFKANLTNKTVKVEAKIYPTEVLMRVGINTKGELRYQNFEVSVDHSAKSQDTIPKIHLAVDAVAALIADYFENGEDHELPFVWEEFPFSDEKIWLKFTSENPDLEAEANKLLGIDTSETLLNETQEELEMLEIPEDEEIDTTRPKIFRVPTNNKNDSLKDKPKKKKKEEMH